MGGAWGTGVWGTGVYGGGVTGIAISSAIAVSTHGVEVTITDEPTHLSPFGSGDALNPSTWAIQRLDDNSFLHVVECEEVDRTVFRLTCIEAFGGAAITHRVSSANLVSVDGEVIVDGSHADFLGVLDAARATPSAEAARRRASSRDLANLPTGTDTAGGTLVIGADGDYATVSGVELLKKLVLRRVLSRPGDFFHLPDYGVGLSLKEPLPGNDVTKLQAEIERQTLREPEVAEARASLTLSRDGVLNVHIRLTDRATGQQVDVPFQVPAGAVQF